MTRVVAVFDSPHAVERAIEALRKAGWRAVSVSSPAFDENLLQLVGATRSPVAASTLAGAVIGVLCGLLLTIGTVRQWPGLIVGGKPLVAMPPFLVIVFELAILFASIGAVGSFLVASKRARRTADAVWGGRTTDDRFALLLELPTAPLRLNEVLQSAGAIEWRTV